MDFIKNLHPIVGGNHGDWDWRSSGIFADCPESLLTMEECTVWWWGVLDADPEKAWSYMRDYWFWGLLWVALSAPILLFTMPI